MKFNATYLQGILRLYASTCAALLLATTARAKTNDTALIVAGQSYSLDALRRENQSDFYELAKKTYDLVEQIGKEKYLESFFAQQADKTHASPEQAKQAYLARHTKISDVELKDALARFKNYPALKDRSEAERTAAVRAYLAQAKERKALSQLLNDAVAKHELQVVFPEPQEPVYTLHILPTEPVRYGPEGQESPRGCQGDHCPITVVEYSDFECPFCGHAQANSQQILSEYRGKIRWIVRDMPLDIHAHARTAAVAAHCAMQQGKYWPMYDALFRSQVHLTQKDLERLGAKIGLDTKTFHACLAKPSLVLSQIEQSIRDAVKLGVSGTPTYFVNGRRVAGAVNLEDFRAQIERSLAGG